LIIILSFSLIISCNSNESSFEKEIKQTVLSLDRTKINLETASCYYQASKTIKFTITPISTISPEKTSIFKYKLSIQNGASTNVFVFMDENLLISIPPEKMGTINGVEEGNHQFQYCQDINRNNCTTSHNELINRDSVWLVGDSKAIDMPTYTSQVNISPPVGTSLPNKPSETPEIINSTPIVTVVSSTTISKPEIKVINRYGIGISIFIDDEFMFIVPGKKYITYENITSGWHVFQFCYALGCIATREIEVKGFTEIYISP